MASYFNLTRDTLAPQNLTATLNDGAQYTTLQTVTLKLSVDDESTTGYQMKIWGVDGVEAEADATSETFLASKAITLTAGDGLKTVYVKVIDDVGNETAAVSTTITLDSTVPVVTVTGPDVSKISEQAGHDTANFTFVSDVAFKKFEVRVVPATDSLHDAGTLIGSTNGSVNVSGEKTDDTTYPADTPITVTIKGKDLGAASAGDGVKIVKIFVENAIGSWSKA